MITKLNQGCWRVLENYYLSRWESKYLREIARDTGLHLPAASKSLALLEKAGIMESYKQANLKIYKIKKNKLAYAALSLFDIQKHNSLPDIRKNALKYYHEKLPEQPVFIVLFGSTAKQTYKAGSDVDLLLITNNPIVVKSAQKEADALTGIRINEFQITYHKFLKEIKLKQEKVIQSAINSGYPLMNHVFYYEVLNNERI
jgi:DNA-binding transcriptional ArsR family regulator